MEVIDIPRSAVVQLVCSDGPTALVSERESRSDSPTEQPCRYTLVMHTAAACDTQTIARHRVWNKERRSRFGSDHEHGGQRRSAESTDKRRDDGLRSWERTGHLFCGRAMVQRHPGSHLHW
jgi:hypothetical protein